MSDQTLNQLIEVITPCEHGEWNVHKHKDGSPVEVGDVVVNVCRGATRRKASPADLVAALVKAVEEGTIEGGEIVGTQVMRDGEYKRRVIPIDFRKPGPYVLVPVREEPNQ